MIYLDVFDGLRDIYALQVCLPFQLLHDQPLLLQIGHLRKQDKEKGHAMKGYLSAFRLKVARDGRIDLVKIDRRRGSALAQRVKYQELLKGFSGKALP